jgi:hypothetical protein
MYYRGGIPAHLVEDGPGSDEDQTDGSLDSETEEDDDAVAYAEAMQWAQGKEEEEVRAHEQKLQSDLQAGNPRPVGPLKGRWDLCSSDYYSGEMACCFSANPASLRWKNMASRRTLQSLTES